jgi:hypothetical protein
VWRGLRDALCGIRLPIPVNQKQQLCAAGPADRWRAARRPSAVYFRFSGVGAETLAAAWLSVARRVLDRIFFRFPWDRKRAALFRVPLLRPSYRQNSKFGYQSRHREC